ncbi:sterol desaturase family protein [Kistimonas asteriae]|uniref:sterol desaturase family protein n=1 Tax=Kistimonas asteriae TaxID=517724 RepID=UPI001BA6B3B9|nr:sterol desaturase family protein [Kistimonas asteriae]
MDFDINLLLLLLTPLYLVTIGAEFFYLRKHRSHFPESANYSLADTVSNAMLAGMYQLVEALTGVMVIAVYYWLFDVRLFEIPVTAWSIALLFLLQDFFYYWFHRACHNIRWMWAAHVVHHSSEKLNFSTAFRQSLMYPVAGMWVFWTPMVMLGFPPETVIAVVLMNLFYQFFIHTQVIPKLGWFEWIFNTPAHHRLHHARNPSYIDRNFGGILIIWDRLFGTFVDEKPGEACEYGITRQICSHNPITLSFHEWRDMLRDAFAPGKRMGQRLRHLFGYPDWQPDESSPEPSHASSLEKVEPRL